MAISCPLPELVSEQCCCWVAYICTVCNTVLYQVTNTYLKIWTITQLDLKTMALIANFFKIKLICALIILFYFKLRILKVMFCMLTFDNQNFKSLHMYIGLESYSKCQVSVVYYWNLFVTSQQVTKGVCLSVLFSSLSFVNIHHCQQLDQLPMAC